MLCHPVYKRNQSCLNAGSPGAPLIGLEYHAISIQMLTSIWLDKILPMWLVIRCQYNCQPSEATLANYC